GVFGCLRSALKRSKSSSHNYQTRFRPSRCRRRCFAAVLSDVRRRARSFSAVTKTTKRIYESTDKRATLRVRNAENLKSRWTTKPCDARASKTHHATHARTQNATRSRSTSLRWRSQCQSQETRDTTWLLSTLGAFSNDLASQRTAS